MNDPVHVNYIPAIRFVDIDKQGHVNNAVYLTYFEEARIHYFNTLIGKSWDWDEQGLILASNQIEYKSPLLLEDEPVITVWCDRVGNKSFRMQYKMRKTNGDIVCTGHSVVVCFNYKDQKSIPVPDSWRKEFTRDSK